MGIGWLSIWLLFLVGCGNGADVRIKRQDAGGGDFFSNLGTTLNKVIGSFLGVNRNADGSPIQSQQSQQPFIQQQPQQLPPQQTAPVVQQPQIQQSQDLPTLGTNSAYDRRVQEINRGRKNKRPHQVQPQPQPQPNVQPFPQVGQPSGPPPPPQQQSPIHVLDQNGKLNYCSDNPADCAYLSCLAENFQHSEEAHNLQMAGKVFLDRSLRRAVANDPLISQVACDKVGLDAQGCQGFRQLLGLVDKFDPGPSSQERNRDPEAHGRRKRAKTIDYDYDHIDVNGNTRSNGHTNVNAGVNANRPITQTNNGQNGQGQNNWNQRPNGNPGLGQGAPNGNQGFNGNRPGPVNSGNNGQGPIGNGNNGQGPNNGNRPGPNFNGNGQGPNFNGNNGRGPNGNVQRPNTGPGPTNGQPNGANRPPPNGNAGNRGHHGSIDYSDYYEHGASKNGGNRGGSGGGPAVGGGSPDQGYKPKDCKAIVRNANANQRRAG